MPANIVRRLPGGYGIWSGDEAYLDNASDQFGRNLLQEEAGGWIVSTGGDNDRGTRQTVNGGANVQRFYYIAPRQQSVRVASVRIGVGGANAGAIARTAMYLYDRSKKIFTRIPGTAALFDASTTGTKSTDLAVPVDVMPRAMLFIAFWSNDNTATFTSYADGNQQVLVPRAITTTNPLGDMYPLGSLSNTNGSMPYVAYLSRDANLVL